MPVKNIIWLLLALVVLSLFWDKIKSAFKGLFKGSGIPDAADVADAVKNGVSSGTQAAAQGAYAIGTSALDGAWDGIRETAQEYLLNQPSAPDTPMVYPTAQEMSAASQQILQYGITPEQVQAAVNSWENSVATTINTAQTNPAKLYIGQSPLF